MLHGSTGSSPTFFPHDQDPKILELQHPPHNSKRVKKKNTNHNNHNSVEENFSQFVSSKVLVCVEVC